MQTERQFNIHGDNIVECVRALDYIVAGLGELVKEVAGPSVSVTCPVYSLLLDTGTLRFQFLPGYGERRWNQDVLGFVKRSGGRLREAADAVITELKSGSESAIAAIEFCGALPAGNQAWQRQGRAFSFAHAHIPYFFVAELGGFELGAARARKAERMPNPAIPFSFYTMTRYEGSVCLPVYEANAGTTVETVERYSSIFGKAEFLEFLKLAILGQSTGAAGEALAEKSSTLVELLADAKTKTSGLTGKQWREAKSTLAAGGSLIDFLSAKARLAWSKLVSIKSLTSTARRFMDLGAKASFGLTSSKLPLSYVPKEQRTAFAKAAKAIYPNIDAAFVTWLGRGDRHLAIAWLNGFKPGGDDARPDRGLAPLARMLAGNEADLLTFVYGPAPKSHAKLLATNPVRLAASNGLWEAILAVSDGVLSDGGQNPPPAPAGYLKDAWSAALQEQEIPLHVEPKVLSLGEQDVDTALHVAFESLGNEVAFEGMCNPPGGDWSGISFRWAKDTAEHRWLTLPRVSASNAKRPDHVFALFDHGDHTVCLCIESKERARSLESDIGPRLVRYTEQLFASAPSIHRGEKLKPWGTYEREWAAEPITFLSAGAYLAAADDLFRGLPAGTNLDLQIAVSFSADAQACEIHLRGDTETGKALAIHLVGLRGWSPFVTVKLINN